MKAGVVDVIGDISASGDVEGATLTGTLATAAQGNVTSLGTLTTLTVDDITINGSSIVDAGNLLIDSGDVMTLDADGGHFSFSDNGTVLANIKSTGIFSSNHITASGNISSSGTITAATLDAAAVSDTLAAAIVAEIDNDEIPIAKLAADAVTVTAGTGLTGGGSVTLGGSTTVNVIGGDGITANANDVAITAAQTTITSVLATDIKIGEDDETKVDFETANEIHYYVNNIELVNMNGSIVSGSGASTASFGHFIGDGGGLTGVTSTVDIDGFDAFSGVPHATQDEFLMSDNGTEKRATMTMVANGGFALVSGDATIAAGGALTNAAAQTSINSILATDLIVGEDAQTAVNFETANEIHFDVNNSELVNMKAGVVDVIGDISASGNIKGSALFAGNHSVAAFADSSIQLGFENNTPIQIGKSANPVLFVGHITASGNISGSSTSTLTLGGDVNIVKDKLKIGGTAVTTTAAELNFLDTAAANSVVNSKAVIYGSSGELAGTLSTAAQGNVTSLGTLTTLTVDDITINGSKIEDAGALTIEAGSNMALTTTANDIFLTAAGKDVSLTDGSGTAEFIFNLEDAPELDVDGNFTIDGSGLIKLDSATSIIETLGNITASGDISSSGTITAEQITSTDDITAAGDITVGQSIFHSGDTDTKIVYTADVITFTAGNEQLLQLSEGGQDQVIVGDGGDVDFHVKAGGSNTLFAQGSSQRIGIGTSTPGQKLEVVGNISASGELDVKHRFFDTGSVQLGSNGGGIGDIIKIGDSSTVPGAIYQLQGGGTWALTDADAAASATGSIAVALGANSTTNGMLLRGLSKLNHDPGGLVGAPLYLAVAAGSSSNAVPSGNNDIARVVGYNIDTSGMVYFNPDNTFVEVTA
tara:strand:- start:159 stop:2792 length:2634 start_codon:yes stop_codon:yes gene_type:complete